MLNQNFAAAIDSHHQSMNHDENNELCCDDLLHEIAIGSVEGLLDESDYDDMTEVEVPLTPEAISMSDVSFSQASYDAAFVAHYPGAPVAAWPTDSYMIPSHRSMPNEGGEITTVMLRNIPNKYTRAGLLVALTEHGFDPATCNNLYLPMDTESGCNLGYAFLNFVSHGHALEFKTRFDGCRLPSSGSRKVCSVVWANKQGLFQFSNGPPAPPLMPQLVSGMVPAPVAHQHLLMECNSSQVRYHQLPPTDSAKIFIGGLPVSTTDADLYNYFSKFGPVKECNIIINRETGLSRGFGFVDFMYLESVRIVDEAQQRRPHVINCRVVSVRFYGAYSGISN